MCRAHLRVVRAGNARTRVELVEETPFGELRISARVSVGNYCAARACTTGHTATGIVAASAGSARTGNNCQLVAVIVDIRLCSESG